MTLDCTDVQSEDQLSYIFNQTFPVTEFNKFRINSSDTITFLDSINNAGLTFEVVNLSPGPFALMAVSEYFLLASKQTLTELTIRDSQLTTDTFPFLSLNLYPALSVLDLSGSAISVVPPLLGSMEYVDLGYGNISEITPGW